MVMENVECTWLRSKKLKAKAKARITKVSQARLRPYGELIHLS